MVIYTFFSFLYIFLPKKKNQLSIKLVFKDLDQYFWLEITNTYTTKQLIIFSSTSLIYIV